MAERNIPPFPWFGVDIGGSLTKMVYFDPEPFEAPISPSQLIPSSDNPHSLSQSSHSNPNLEVPSSDHSSSLAPAPNPGRTTNAQPSNEVAHSSSSNYSSSSSSRNSINDEVSDIIARVNLNSHSSSSQLTTSSNESEPTQEVNRGPALLVEIPETGATSGQPINLKERIFLSNIRRYLMSTTAYGATGKRDQYLEMRNVTLHGRRGTLHFIHFPTSEMSKFIDLVQSRNLKDVADSIYATGGGAYKFEPDFRDRMQMELHQCDELTCVLKGIDFVYRVRPGLECYYWENPDDSLRGRKVKFDFSNPYPYLCVNVGSGVSMLAVHGPSNFQRVCGTSLGGGTFLGLCCLLTGCNSFEEAITLAVEGDHTAVDKLVRDIYGGNYTRFGLPGGIVASSFGHMIDPDRRERVTKADLARSTLVTITNNIGSISVMCARQHKIDRIVFVGNFFRYMNSISARSLSAALEFWSGGKTQALFLEHEGYFGAVGCLLELLRHDSLPEAVDLAGDCFQNGESSRVEFPYEMPLDPLQQMIARSRESPFDSRPWPKISPIHNSPPNSCVALNIDPESVHAETKTSSSVGLSSGRIDSAATGLAHSAPPPAAGARAGTAASNPSSPKSSHLLEFTKTRGGS